MAAHMKTRLQYKLYFLLMVFVSLNIVLWSYSHEIKVKWINVPPVPSEFGSVVFALGDKQLAYRTYGVMLQNLGDSDGDTKPLTVYNYDTLGEWFMMMDHLDPRSDFVPLLAAYYFGATPQGEDLGPVISYLGHVGQYPGYEKWRWLAQAVYLARFRFKDNDIALKHAYKLSALHRPGMPMWAKQMPAFVMNDIGDKEAALQLMTSIMVEQGDKIHPNEVNFMKHYICDRILSEDESASLAMCDGSY